MELADLLAVPYNRHGSSPDTGFNCYTLAKYVRHRFFTLYSPPIDLHDFTEEEGSAVIVDWGPHWQETDTPEAGDWVFMRGAGKQTWHHCGVLLDNDQVIHAYEFGGLHGKVMIHSLPILRRRFEAITFARWLA